MAPRLYITAEGQTEESYANNVLKPFLAGRGIFAAVRRVWSSRKHGRVFRGGLRNYENAKADIIRWMKENSGQRDAFFTTMFDLYAYPRNSPGYEAAQAERDPYKKVAILEDALKQDLQHPNFIPYIQLHEFETLILADPAKLDWEYIAHEGPIRNLVEMVAGKNPEEINEGQETAPSKRIIKEIPEYKGQKATIGPLVAAKIDLDVLREKCKHFNEWLTRLEKLNEVGADK